MLPDELVDNFQRIVTEECRIKTCWERLDDGSRREAITAEECERIAVRTVKLLARAGSGPAAHNNGSGS